MGELVLPICVLIVTATVFLVVFDAAQRATLVRVRSSKSRAESARSTAEDHRTADAEVYYGQDS